MTQEFVPYEQALALKELGFDEPCFAWFILEGDGAKSRLVLEKCPKQDIGLCLAPLYQQAFRWFREKYRLDGHVTFRESTTNKIEGINSVYYDVEIYTLMSGDAYKTYNFKEISDKKEEAELTCLIKLIEIVKSKQCSKNGIKKEGESCTLNNNCIYPNCINDMTNIERKEYNINCANFLNWIYVSSIDLKENKYPQVAKAGWYEFITDKVIPEKFLAKSYIGRSNHDLKFDSDWNYINLVLDKIAKLDYGWKVTSKYVNIYSHIGDPKGNFDCKHSTNCPIDVKLDTIRTINQFLIWYNKNK